jgi:hypothetical protein
VEAARQYHVPEAETRFSRALEPAAGVVPARLRAHRTGRGSLRDRIRIAEDFDELPADMAEAFGTDG